MTFNVKHDDALNKNEPNALKRPFILRRTWLKIFSCTGCYIMFLLRYNLSVAILPIKDEKILFNETDEATNMTMTRSSRRYDIDDLMTGQMLAAYFYGYTFFQLPFGRLSELLGGKWLLGFGLLVSGIGSLLTPTLLDVSPIAMIICRVVIGSFQCGILCCSYTLFAEWLPNNMKANAITLANIGFELGGISSFFFTGLLSENLGWRSSFYIFSTISFIWFIPFCFMVSSRPEDCKSLSDYERELIAKERMMEYKENFLNNQDMVKIPPKFNWRVIFTSGPVWASGIAKAAVGLGYYIVTTKMPAYLQDIFHVELKSLAIACVGILCSKILCLWLSNFLFDLKLMSLTNLRKTCQAIAMLTPAICLFILTIKNDNQTLCIFLIFVAMFGKGFVCLGDTPITAEFAKDLSGSIFGLTNTLACATGVCAPLISAFFLELYPDDKPHAWNLIFYVTIACYVLALSVFLLFASAEEQPWSVSKFVPIEELGREKNDKKSDQSSA